MPYKVMTPSQLSCVFTRIDNLVTERVVEYITCGLHVHPFLAVGCGDLVELGAVEGDGSVTCVVEDYIVDCRAKVL